ncbi:MAG: hypothetical protein AAGH38_07540 [Pseudomonadota bacterium]
MVHADPSALDIDSTDDDPEYRDLQARTWPNPNASFKSRRGRSKTKYLTRDQHLAAIDHLSRQGQFGLALLFVSTFSLTALSMSDHPGRSLLWAGLVAMSLIYTNNLRARFRRGTHLARRPFRWRSNYTSSLFIVGACVASGLIFLSDQSSDALHVKYLPLILAISGLACAWWHRSHIPAVLATTLPPIVFIVLASIQSARSFHPIELAAIIVASVGAASIAFAFRQRTNF